MRFVLKALLIGTLAAPALGHAQDAAPAAAEAASPETEAAATSDFTKAERLSALRHTHLWLAYGAVWLVFFGFLWRTHAMSRRTEGELQALKRKIESLEGK